MVPPVKSHRILVAFSSWFLFSDPHEMNSWPSIKGRLQPAILTTTKGRWALARGQVLHMVTWGQAVQMGPAEALSPSTPTPAHQRSAAKVSEHALPSTDLRLGPPVELNQLRTAYSWIPRLDQDQKELKEDFQKIFQYLGFQE